jgi:hypothetical protein
LNREGEREGEGRGARKWCSVKVCVEVTAACKAFAQWIQMNLKTRIGMGARGIEEAGLKVRELRVAE